MTEHIPNEMHETNVEGDIICEVAKSHGLGAGGLKGLLEWGTSEETSDRELKAVEEAYKTQAERDGLDWD